MAFFETILGLLFCALLLAVAARRFQVPEAAALLVGGMAAAFVPGLPKPVFDPQLVLALFLPPLLYKQAFFTSWREFRALMRPIFLLAVGLVVVTTLGVGAALKLMVPELPWAVCFVFGAIVSPPDAVSATAILNRVRLPRRVVAILEGESLVNDASGLVLFNFAVVAATTGSFSLTDAAGSFVVMAAGGVAVGLAMALAAEAVFRGLAETRAALTFSFLFPFGAYLAAEHLHLSGVLAVVAAGLWHGWRAPELFGPDFRIEARATWEFVVFLLETIVFLLIGMQLDDLLTRIEGTSFVVLAGLVLASSAAAIAIRMLWVFPAAYLPHLLSAAVRRTEVRPPWTHTAIVGWTGMRGVVSLAAALAIPMVMTDGEPFPGRDLITVLAFGVILVTVIGQGTTLRPLIRLLGVRENLRPPVDDADARRKMSHAAVEALDIYRADDVFLMAARGFVRDEYERRLAVVPDPSAYDAAGSSGIESVDAVRTLRLVGLEAERRRLLKLRRERQIDDALLQRLQDELDLEDVLVRHGRV